MASWEPYSLAIVRGGVHALAVGAAVQADVLRSIEKAAGFADPRALRR